MELNIAPVPQQKSAKNAPAPKNKKFKGSWRKRRREEVIHRAKQEKRLRPSPRHVQKSKALKIQSDEFASGIEEVKGGMDGEGKRKDEEHGTKAEEKAEAGKKKEKDNGEEGAGKRATIKGDGIVEKKKWTGGGGGNEIISRDDQKPDAVNAALAIIGKSGIRSVKGDGEASGEEAEDVDLENEDGKKKVNETFGVTSFEDTGLYPSVARHLVHRMEVAMPTHVQEKVLKVMLNLEEGKQAIDVLIRSATGSGKTLAYLLPIAHYFLNRVKRISREDGSYALIIVPTRELAEQVEDVAEQVFRPWHWIVTGSVRGGESKHREKSRLRKGITVLVATPGRLLDHMRNTRSFEYGLCEFLVLDEADRLLDLGFEGEIKEIIENLNNQARIVNPEANKTRSNLLLSATLRADVDKLAEFSLESPVEVSVGKGEGNSKNAFAMPQLLRQHFCVVDQRHRLVTLTCFLRLRALKDVPNGMLRAGETDAPPCKVIVFFSTCDSVDFHYELLTKTTVPKELLQQSGQEGSKEKMIPLDIFRIHGNHAQTDRVQALRGFRKSKRAVLFCTDVAARGLDLKGLTFAIQYDPPTGGQGEELEYLHRAGRTARIGEQGDALLFLLPSERAYIGKLESKGVSIAEISGSAAMAALYPKVNLMKQESISYGTRLVTSVLQESFEEIVKGDEALKQLAMTGFQAYCRAYATHAREVRYFFHVRNLHLGHVARAFVLGDKPAELNQMMAEIKAAKRAGEGEDDKRTKNAPHDTKMKGAVARAIADGEWQPYNDQTTELARRRREKGRGQEAFRELAMEFGS